MLSAQLINCTPITNNVAELACTVCTGHEKNWIEDNRAALKKALDNAIKSGHLSVLEHISFTWLVKNASRALTHQLVRHRIASYSQQSQRYCKITTDKDDKCWYVVPQSIADSNETKALYYKAMNGIATIYNELLSKGVPKEDARMVLPNACKSTILVTMNARAFIEAAEKRLCNRAQWEIRELFSIMRDRVKPVYPNIADLAVPRCAKTGCTESKPCGKPWSKT